MGRFSDMQIEIVDMYVSDGMSEEEIAKSLGISLLDVHSVLDEYENTVNDLLTEESDTIPYDEEFPDPDELAENE